VLFLVYVTIHELNMLFGDGELYRFRKDRLLQ